MGESSRRSSSSRHRRSERSLSPRPRSERRDRSRSPHRRQRRDYRDESDDDRSREHRHSRHRSHHKKHRRSSSSESSSSSDSEDERRSRKRHKHKKEKAKKHKKDKKKSKKEKKHKSRAVGDDWGKYGIIHEADIFTKEAEFQAWLIEVKHADVETLNNIKRKEMFLDFMEDYNTATMPHDKFYDMSKWESRQHAVRMGDPLPPSDSTFNFANDEEQLRMQHRMAARMASSKKSSLTLSQEQIEELAKVNRERIQAERMRKMGLVPKGNMGVRYEYE